MARQLRIEFEVEFYQAEGRQKTKVNDAMRHVEYTRKRTVTRFFGLSDGFWERLQIDYDLAVAKDEMAETLKRIKPYAAACRVRPHSARQL